MVPLSSTVRPGMNFSVAGFGVASVWINMTCSGVAGSRPAREGSSSRWRWQKHGQGPGNCSLLGRRPKSVIASEATQSRTAGRMDCFVARAPRNDESTSRQRVDVLVAEVARHDGDGNREGADHLGHGGDNWSRTLGAFVGRQHQHRNIDVLVDHVENLLGGVAFADRALRGDRAHAVGAAGRTVKRGIGLLMRFRAHDVGNPEPLLVLVLGLDHAQHHHPAADAHRPAAPGIDGAVPFRAVVNANPTLRLLAGVIASTLRAHRGPEAASDRRMLPHPPCYWEGRTKVPARYFLRMKPTISLTASMVSEAMTRARSAPSISTEST